MHDHNAWAGLNGEKHKGKHPHTWVLFKDCLELQKVTIFSMDAAKRQKFYIQQGVQKPQHATVHLHILIKVLNGHLGHLSMLKNSPKAVLTTKKGNISFSEANLAAILLVSVPITWQNQYNLTHSTVPEVQ
jgi:hypothetical protein